MHPLIDIAELDKLNDIELIRLEAALRDIIFTHDLARADLLRCLASLSNAVFVRSLREARPVSKIRAP